MSEHNTCPVLQRAILSGNLSEYWFTIFYASISAIKDARNTKTHFMTKRQHSGFLGRRLAEKQVGTFAGFRFCHSAKCCKSLSVNSCSPGFSRTRVNRISGYGVFRGIARRWFRRKAGRKAGTLCNRLCGCPTGV